MKIVVLASGGLDSTVLLYHAVNLHGKDNIKAISFDYGSKHNDMEIGCAKANCKKLGVEHQTFDIPFIRDHFKSTLLQTGGQIPYGHYEADNMKQTVIPLRNGIMLMAAAGYADSIGFDKVWIASHAGDHVIYLDCRPAFNRAINEIIRFGTEIRVSIEAPFNQMTKTGIVKRGIELKTPFQKTYSCYEGQSRPCLKCATCLERIISFRDNNIKDPLLTNEEWAQGLKNAEGMK